MERATVRVNEVRFQRNTTKKSGAVPPGKRPFRGNIGTAPIHEQPMPVCLSWIALVKSKMMRSISFTWFDFKWPFSSVRTQ